MKHLMDAEDSPKMRYTKQLLNILEKDLSINEMNLDTAMENIIKLKEERKDLLKALCTLEEMEQMEEQPDPNLISIKHLFFRDGEEVKEDYPDQSGIDFDLIKLSYKPDGHDCSLEALKESFKTEGDE